MAKREREQETTEGDPQTTEMLKRLLALHAEVQALARAQHLMSEQLGKIVRQVERRIGALDLQQLS